MSEENVFLSKGNQSFTIPLEKLKKEIAECLQIEHLNFLIGSGCSSRRDNGNEQAIPTMTELSKLFFEENKEFKLLKTELPQEYKENLELVLETLVALRMINNLKVVDKSIDSKIMLIHKHIREAINDGMKDETVKNFYKEFYLKILRKNRQNPINIFTTNYDLFSEWALDELGFFYNNGFTGTYKRKFNPITFNYAYVENMNLSKDIWERIPNFFNLYKIHGSINWYSKNHEIIETTNKSLDEATMMIYPTPLKDRTTLMTPYSDLMRNMQYSLMKNNSILVTLGYSFSDEHINRIILNTLSIPSFRLVIFGSGVNIDKLKSINDNRIWIINSDDKIHYFDNIVRKVLPDMHDDILEQKSLIEKLILATNIIQGETKNDKS